MSHHGRISGSHNQLLCVLADHRRHISVTVLLSTVELVNVHLSAACQAIHLWWLVLKPPGESCRT